MPRLTNVIKDWFDMPDDPDKGRVEIRHLKKGEINDIEDRIERFETLLRTDPDGNLNREIKVNPAKGAQRYAFLCAAVSGWENFLDLDGEPMPCTDENKIRMARDDEAFGAFVGKCRTELAERVARDREAARKNSTT